MTAAKRNALFGARLGIALLGAALPAFAAPAQEPPQAGTPAAQPGTAAKSTATKLQAAKSATGSPAASTAGGESGLKQRVEQLEEQLVDLQVVTGTLESLARSGGNGAAGAQPYRAAPAGTTSAADQARIDGLETQIRALTTQVEQLTAELHGQGGAQRRSDGAAYAPGAPQEKIGTTRFGSTTVNSGSSDPIGGIIDGASPKQGTPLPEVYAPGQPAPGRIAAVDPAAVAPDAGNPKQLYENAYGYLLQQDYGAAQAGFGDFLKRYPKDPLAPNALYWLGETHYVQKNFSDAAEAFDLVTQSFGSSAKAPDAQLKRGMSLAQLGKKDESCSVFRQLGSKYPNAPAHVKTKSDSERQRLGCP